MKKYLPYILVVLVLGAVAAWFLLRPTPQSINQIEGAFAVKDVNEVTRISIQDHQKRHVEITKKDGKWWVDDKYIVRDDMMKQVLDVISRIESLSPVPSNGHDNVIRSMATEFIKVDVYTGGSKPEKSYLVGGPTVDSKGTYMLLDMGEKMATRPHIAFVPGYNGYVTPIFKTDPQVWRTRAIFKYRPEDIKTLKVEYPGKPENSFQIIQVNADSFTIAPIDERYRINQPNEGKYVKQYLSFYNDIQMETFNNTSGARDSITRTTPVCKFTVVDTKGEENEVVMYYMPINKRSKERYDDYGREITHDVDRYYATVNHGADFTIVQYVVFGKLLRSYKDFYFKPKA